MLIQIVLSSKTPSVTFTCNNGTNELGALCTSRWCLLDRRRGEVVSGAGEYWAGVGSEVFVLVFSVGTLDCLGMLEEARGGVKGMGS